MPSELSKVLDAVGSFAELVGKTPPHPAAGIVANIIAITMKSAAAFARSGMDPVAEIQRIHSADAGVADVIAQREKALRDKFWIKSAPPPAPLDSVPPPPDTQPSPPSPETDDSDDSLYEDDP